MPELKYIFKMFRKLFYIVILLFFTGLYACQEDVGAFFIHESVNRRVMDSRDLQPPYTGHFQDSLPLKFAFFSDIHITRDNENLFDKLQRDIAEKNIGFFVVAGDLTDHGLEEEYQICRDDFIQMGIPWYVTIGNHDMYQNNSWEIWKEYFGPSCYTVAVTDNLRLIFLDTSTGTVGKDQFDWLEDVLKNSGEQYKIVISHYPLYDDPFPSIWRLPGAGERYKLFHLFDQYDVYGYVSGHLHTFQHKTIHGIQHFIVGSMNPHKLDKGEHGYLLFTLDNYELTWEQVVFP